MKTCSFNDVKPRFFENRFREGLFCIDTPESQFAIQPCNQFDFIGHSKLPFAETLSGAFYSFS
jgi:hypothetical protein